MLRALVIVAAAYLLGSIPWSYLTAAAAGHKLSTVGDGNIGAHNVMRHAGRGWGVVALLLDAGKGALAVVVARTWGSQEWLPIGAALVAVLGHNYPLWLGFRGGKGLATSLGAALALFPALSWLVLLVTAITLAVTRNLAFTGLLAALALTLAAYIKSYDVAYVLAPLGLLALMGWRQLPDLRRMWRESHDKRDLILHRWIRDREARL
ncbi:MAG TPA: glycerol-3-phosphate acyltransferase [Herpetosiphonaceae bacterium]|nr:glycerol-3-phosphate acyltransferase [Herpetosiphonaceae bacterium]